MNKQQLSPLEQYRDEQTEKFGKPKPKFGGFNGPIEYYKQGFDAAIALDLPVKFATWSKGVIPNDAKDLVRTIIVKNGHLEVRQRNELGEAALYQYWLDNVYTLEK